MKYLILLCSVLVLMGCSATVITSSEITKALKICDGKVDYILMHNNREFDHVVCSDAKEVKISGANVNE